jgi:hypothetical protein
MATIHLIPLTRSEGQFGENNRDPDISLNVFHILIVEDTLPGEIGNSHSRITLTTGKVIYVDQTQAEIRDLANDVP